MTEEQFEEISRKTGFIDRLKENLERLEKMRNDRYLEVL